MTKFTSLLVFILLTIQIQLTQAQYLPHYEKKESWNGLSILNLKGKVKSLKQTAYLTIDSAGVIKKGPQKNTNDDISPNVNSNCLILFDDKGRTTEETYYIRLGKGGQYVPYLHTYNDSLNIEEMVDGPRGNAYYIYTYQYDSKGRITEDFMSQLIGKDNRFDQKRVYKYDEKGNKVEQIYYTSESKLKIGTKTIYKHQKTGNQTIIEGYNDKGGIQFKNSYRTDSKGNIIERDYYTSDFKNIDHIFRFKYDDYGNEIQKEYYKTADKPIKIWSYKYEYDKHNNWIKRTDFENGKVTSILERELKYYN